MASTTRNIFTLGEYTDDTLAGEGVPLPSVWAGDTRFVDGRAKLPSNMYFTGIPSPAAAGLSLLPVFIFLEFVL